VGAAVNVTFCAPGCWSPIRRLTHRFATLTSSALRPGFARLPMSIRYGANQLVPASLPLTRTSARSPTLPRSIHSGAPAFIPLGRVKLLL
jgi:hypothetical protein